MNNSCITTTEQSKFFIHSINHITQLKQWKYQVTRNGCLKQRSGKNFSNYTQLRLPSQTLWEKSVAFSVLTLLQIVKIKFNNPTKQIKAYVIFTYEVAVIQLQVVKTNNQA